MANMSDMVIMSDPEAAGADFDRLFLARMIAHHASAGMMADAVGWPSRADRSTAWPVTSWRPRRRRSGRCGDGASGGTRPPDDRSPAGAAMSRSVLIVDDEPGIVELASAHLRRDGFAVRTARTGRRALDAIATQPPDLAVLDLMLPDISGEEVCTALRRISAVRILMLTARSAEADRLRGLALGADDHLVKPFSPRELVARVHAILRRTPSPPPTCSRSAPGASRSTSPPTRPASTALGCR